MKRFIPSLKKGHLAAFIAGIFFASGVAYAGTTGFWKQSGSTYRCQGTSTTVFCKETNWSGPKYEVAIVRKLIGVQYGGKLIFACERKWKPVDNCSYYGP